MWQIKNNLPHFNLRFYFCLFFLFGNDFASGIICQNIYFLNCVKKKMSIPGKTRRITFYFYWRLSNESLDPGFGITISEKTGAATGIEENLIVGGCWVRLLATTISSYQAMAWVKKNDMNLNQFMHQNQILDGLGRSS